MPRLTSEQRLTAQALAERIISSVGELPAGICDELVKIIGKKAWPLPKVHIQLGNGLGYYDQWEGAGPYKIACDGHSAMEIIHWQEAGLGQNEQRAELRRKAGRWIYRVSERKFVSIPIWINARVAIGYDGYRIVAREP